MAFIFSDGCDNYTTDTDIITRWSSVDVSELNFDAAAGRYGGGGIVFFDDTFDLRKDFANAGTAATTDELFVSASIYWPTLSAGEEPLFVFLNSASQFSLTLSTLSTGALTLRDAGSAGTLLATSSAGVITTGTWHRVELRVVIASGTAGLYEVRVDEVAVLGPTTGVDTNGTAIDGASSLVLSGNNAASVPDAMIFDDIIVHNSAGSNFNTFLGDIRIETLRPSGAGNSTDGTPSAGANWETVDETGVNDGDTSYVDLATVGDKDTYAMGNLASSPASIHAVVACTVSKGTSGNRDMQAIVRSGSSEANGATHVATGSYTFFQSPFYVNPATSAAFTTSEVNSMEIGQEAV